MSSGFQTAGCGASYISPSPLRGKSSRSLGTGCGFVWLLSRGNVSTGFELRGPERAVVYVEATEAVSFALWEGGQAAAALWEVAGHRSQLTGRQGCLLIEVMACCVFSGRAGKSRVSGVPCSCCYC